MSDVVTRILLVEDNPGEAQLLRETLAEARERFEVSHAETMAAALEQLRSNCYDAVLLDLSLPDSHGIGTLEHVTAAAPRLPIIVLTGWDDEALATEAISKGGQDYLVKGEVGGALLVRAIRYGRQRKRMEESLRQTVERLQLLSEITAELLSSSDPKATVQSLCRKVMKHLDCQVFFNYLVDEQKQQLRLNACAGITPEFAKRIALLDFATATCRCVADHGCPVASQTAALAPNGRLEVMQSLDLCAYACHPLRNQGRVIGMLSFGSRSKSGFGEDELAVMRVLTDQVAIAIQRVRLLESLEHRVAERTAEAEQRTAQLRALAAELIETEQRERRHLAEVLHDHLQQLLFSARVKVSLLRRRVADESLAQFAGEVDRLLEESILASRSLTVELSPPVLYEAGLEAALHWLAEQMEEKHTLAVDLKVDPQAEPADEATRMFLFQAIRELLFNVVKHAEVQRACVRLTKTEDRKLILEVSDQGSGMRPESWRSSIGISSGFGLFSIRERLAPLGGSMEVTSALGEGTRITITMPFGQLPLPADSGPMPAIANGLPRGQKSARRRTAAGPASGKLRIVLADDHPIVRKGLADMLNERAEFELVGEASDGQEAWELAWRTRPDVVLMDVTMPKVSGIESTRRITAELPGVTVIGLSMHEGADTARTMCEAGAVAYLRKDTPPDALIAAILSHLRPVHASGNLQEILTRPVGSGNKDN